MMRINCQPAIPDSAPCDPPPDDSAELERNREYIHHSFWLALSTSAIVTPSRTLAAAEEEGDTSTRGVPPRVSVASSFPTLLVPIPRGGMPGYRDWQTADQS
jgi:hypothetical protein